MWSVCHVLSSCFLSTKCTKANCQSYLLIWSVWSASAQPLLSHCKKVREYFTLIICFSTPISVSDSKAEQRKVWFGFNHDFTAKKNQILERISISERSTSEIRVNFYLLYSEIRVPIFSVLSRYALSHRTVWKAIISLHPFSWMCPMSVCLLLFKAMQTKRPSFLLISFVSLPVPFCLVLSGVIQKRCHLLSPSLLLLSFASVCLVLFVVGCDAGELNIFSPLCILFGLFYICSFVLDVMQANWPSRVNTWSFWSLPWITHLSHLLFPWESVLPHLLFPWQSVSSHLLFAWRSVLSHFWFCVVSISVYRRCSVPLLFLGFNHPLLIQLVSLRSGVSTGPIFWSVRSSRIKCQDSVLSWIFSSLCKFRSRHSSFSKQYVTVSTRMVVMSSRGGMPSRWELYHLTWFLSIQIATDIICGFPTEDEEDFKGSLALLEKYKFPIINIAQFYPRPGTPAAKMKRVPTGIVKDRSRAVTSYFVRILCLIAHKNSLLVLNGRPRPVTCFSVILNASMLFTRNILHSSHSQM